jgi:hypothetical protein
MRPNPQPSCESGLADRRGRLRGHADPPAHPRLLVLKRGWSPRRFAQFIADLMVSSLLPDSEPNEPGPDNRSRRSTELCPRGARLRGDATRCSPVQSDPSEVLGATRFATASRVRRGSRALPLPVCNGRNDWRLNLNALEVMVLRRIQKPQPTSPSFPGSRIIVPSEHRHTNPERSATPLGVA